MKRTWRQAAIIAAMILMVGKIKAQVLNNSSGQYWLTPASPAPKSFAIGNAPTLGYALDVHGEQMNPPLGNVFKTDAPEDQDSYWRMFRGDREYGNLFNPADSMDFHVNATRGYLHFLTNTVDRVAISPTLTGQTVNQYTNLDLSGHLGIGTPVPHQPLAFIHINNNGTLFRGYRPWMLTGAYMSENSDGMYVGTKKSGSDRIDAVIDWSDNREGWVYGPDALRFIFTRTPDSSSAAAKYHGLELARIIPASNGNEGYFGIGDFFTAGATPTERLDVLDGRVRIRQLPTDPADTTLNKYMVVADDGVVHWRSLGNAGGGCEWTLQGAAGSNSSISTAYPSNTGCPQMDKGVGIGVQTPKAKLDVYHDTFGPEGPLGRVGVRSITVANDLTNLFVGVHGEAVAQNLIPVQIQGARNIGVQGFASLGQLTIGVSGEARQIISSTAYTVGVHGLATIDPDLTFGFAAGVYGDVNAPDTTNAWAGYFHGPVQITGSLYHGANYIFSDASLKTDIQPLGDPAAQLSALAPSTYAFTPEARERLGLPAGEQIGLVAQDVEQVLPQAVSSLQVPAVLDTLGNVVEAALDLKAVNYVELIPLLIAGYQQQQAMIGQQQATIDALQSQIDQCCAAQGGDMAPQGGSNSGSMPQDQGDLKEQRLLVQPNPFTDHTTLYYYVPKGGKVSLQVSNSDGRALSTLREEQAEAGAYSYAWNTAQLASGTYFCALLVDGQVVVKRAVKVAR